jgi:hypothetical protein
MELIRKAVRMAVAAIGIVASATAVAQTTIPFTNLNPGPDTQGAPASRASALQNVNGPKGTNYQVNYPYPGQCLANAGQNRNLFPQLVACSSPRSRRAA